VQHRIGSRASHAKNEPLRLTILPGVRGVVLTGITALVSLLMLILSAPLVAEAQQAAVATIGWLANQPTPSLAMFRDALRDLGYVEGQSVVIEPKYAGDRADLLYAFATEMVTRKVDVIIAAGSTAAVAAQRATRALPIVFVSGDPVAQGFVVSLARPGGNMTGIAAIPAEVNGKRLEVLQTVAPRVRRLAVLDDATGTLTAGGRERMFQSLHAAARQKGVELLRIEIRGTADFDAAFAQAAGGRAHGLFVQSSPYFNGQRERIVGLAARYRLPAVYEHRDFPDAGGLISYGPDWRDVYHKVAGYTDRLLKGAKPGDLPVEQPTKFELVLNLKTGKDLAVVIPKSVLARADEVIE